MCNTAEVPRQKIPKDGVGPRGVPDCYYTSRTLNSTFRYEKFVRKLRAEEEEQRKGAETKAKEARDNTVSDFFLRCDRRSLINDVARKVDLCMAAYQEDLKLKRAKLKDMLEREEEVNIRKLVEQAQAGAEELWQEKKNRLQFLLEKRKKEHAEKYKETPLSKCAHILPCIIKLRAKEAQGIQLYQMREKQSRKMAEAEFDQMWHEVAMKQADALAARMEYDAIERLRRDQDCKQYSDYQIKQRHLQRERDKQLLKEETIRMKALWEADLKKGEDEERARKDNLRQIADEQKKIIAEKQNELEKDRAKAKLVSEAWGALAKESLDDQKAQEELRRRKECELDQCNKRLLQLKDELRKLEAKDEEVRSEEAKRVAEVMDQQRCRYIAWAKRNRQEVSQAVKDQIKERQKQKESLLKKKAEEEEYQRQLFSQVEQLVSNKKKMDAYVRKEHQNNLLRQMEYTKLLKERARQEEIDQLKKYLIATEDYKQEIGEMLCRPYFSEHVHPFMQQMSRGLKLKQKCACSKNDDCK